tara:strand:- start:83 stop:247 length:165 start_codon:yes stop_codon:yes gene_type:complete
MKTKTTDLTGFQVIQLIKQAELKEEKKGICMKLKSFLNNLQKMVQRGKHGGRDE